MMWLYQTPLMRSIDLPTMRLSIVDTEHEGFVLCGWTWWHWKNLSVQGPTCYSTQSEED